jgi:rfaE bifunctional protein nucleotidyltransferase chain/domain
MRNQMATEGDRIVLTNGCFDLIHLGHVRYLQKARSLGDRLIVALNDDESVRNLKGKGRPLVPAMERAEVIGALGCVDWVTFFEENTPAELIKALQPDVLVKGGDWTVDQIVGRNEVEAAGGTVLSIPFEKGYSTTDVIRKIQTSH